MTLTPLNLQELRRECRRVLEDHPKMSGRLEWWAERMTELLDQHRTLVSSLHSLLQFQPVVFEDGWWRDAVSYARFALEEIEGKDTDV